MKTAASNALYIPPRIAHAVSAVTEKPLTLICAGSGYGKTTAVVSCLERVPRNTVYRWYTCFGEPPERAWEGICRLISFADARIGGYLGKLELPNVDHLGYISSLMSEISCERETILIIDNFHMAAFPAPYRLLNALAMHGCDKLHIAVLSHALFSDEGQGALDPRVCHVPQDVFCFSQADIVKLFSISGASLSTAQAARLAQATEGWVAALRLHMAGLLAGGELAEGVGINELMELSFWRHLDERQQSLFLGLSLLDTFTEAQAARMLGRDVIPEALWSAVCSNAFVRRAGSKYTLHSLLKSFLSAKLDTKPEVFLRKMYGRAGMANQLQGKNVEAVLLYMDAFEDANTLSVPLTSLQLAELVQTQAENLDAFLSRCRTELLEERCQLLLRVAAQASLCGKGRLSRTAQTRLEQIKVLPNGDTQLQRKAEAALEMAASFQAYNDIAAMSRHHAAVIELLDDPQDFDLTNNSWTFCIPSVVYMFWRQSGKLAESVSLLHQGIPNYALLSGGKGLGGPEIMAAEALLLSGRTDEAATKGYLARAVAQKAGQDSVIFCAHTLFARTALLKGDTGAFLSSLNAIERQAFEGTEFLCLTASEAALGFLYSMLDMESRLPPWLLSPETVRRTLYPVSAPFALIVTLRYIRRHAPEELIGTAEAYIRETDELHHLMPKLYFLLEQAAWYEQRGERKSALEKTRLALALALPDEVYLPFAEYYGELSGVFSDGRLWGGKELERIRALGRQFVNGSAMVRAAITGASPLTPREREIALLAQKRVSTKEIAEKLCVSAATVKNTLNKVYSKLGISGKAELEGKQI